VDCGLRSDDLSRYKKSYNKVDGQQVHTGYCNLCNSCNNVRGTGSKRRYDARVRGVTRAEIRAVITQAKDIPCADCGVRYPSYVMQFDHLDPSQKLFNIGSFTNQTMSQVVAEIAKCEVVCANCHAIRTHTERVAPSRFSPSLRRTASI
jgi:hypothetical protein